MKTGFRSIVIALTLLTLVLALPACGKEEPTPTPVPPTATLVPPTPTPVPPTDTPTPVLPTPTPTPVPPTPTPTPEPAMELTAEYTDEAAGVVLALPEDWFTTSFFGVTLISESEDVLGDAMGGETPELVIVLFAGSFDELGIDPDALGSPADLFEMEGVGPFGDAGALSEDWEMDKIVELEIDGYSAVAAEFASDVDTDEEMNGYVAVVIMEDLERVALFIGGAVPDRWEEMAPTIKAMAHSMTFFEPQVVVAPPGEVELADEPFVSEAQGYSIAYPEGWQSMDMGEVAFFVEDIMAMSGDGVPTAVIVMADATENFLGGALVGITPDQVDVILQMASNQMGEDFELGEAESITVNGIPAAGAELTGTADDGSMAEGYMVLVLGDTQAAIIMAVAPAGQWEVLQPAFEAMLDTFTFTGETAGPVGSSGPVTTGDVGTSRANPIPLGSVGSAAQWDIQVLEVLRGDDAWDELLAASTWNEPPAEGFEYVVAKIAAERTGNDEAKAISSVDFEVTGSGAVLYQVPWLTNPEPELDAELLPGGSTEGWLSFSVWEGEKDLILVYDEAWEWDDEPVYFALEEGAAVPMPDGLLPDGDAMVGLSRAEPAEVGTMIFEAPWEFQVREVIRGDDAYDMLLEANEFNEPPPEGLEYMLLRVHVRNLDTQEEAQEIDGSMFHVTGDNNVLYRYPYVVEPEPELEARLYPGGEWIGWLAFEIGLGEKNPILAFGDTFELGEDGRFVALEEGAAVALPASIEVMGDQASGLSVDDPAPAGAVVAGEQWEFSVLEMLRGDEAWDALSEASEYNDPPDDGMEYVLVRLKVRNISEDDEPRWVGWSMVELVGDNKEVYDNIFATVPESELDAWLFPNGEAEGWIALQAAEGETGLILIFSESYSEQRYLSLEE